MQVKAISLMLYSICLFSVTKEAQVITIKQVNEQLELIRRQGRINQWHMIISITSPEKGSKYITILEKRRSGEFCISWFLPEAPTFKSGYKKISSNILPTNPQYNTISKIESMKIKLNSWGGGVILDGHSYRIEIDSLETQTTLVLSDKSFTGEMVAIKEWIDYICNAHVRATS